MLFWISLAVMVISIITLTVSDVYTRSKMCDSFAKRHRAHNVFFISGMSTLISSVLTVLFLIIIVFTHIGTDAEVAQRKAQYDALTYKLESEFARDEFGLLNNETIDEVQEWNEDLAYLKAMQRDFWMGIFYPNIYDDLELIDYGGIK